MIRIPLILRARSLFGALLLPLLLPVTARADLVTSDSYRKVNAATVLNSVQKNQSNQTFPHGPSMLNAQVVQSNGNSSLMAIVSQASSVPDIVGNSIWGMGSALIKICLANLDTGGVPPAPPPDTNLGNNYSLFDYRFQVTTPGTYRFQGNVTFDAGSMLSSGFARAELLEVIDPNLDQVVFLTDAHLTGTGTINFDDDFFLIPGKNYRVLGGVVHQQANLNGPVEEYTSLASFQLALTEALEQADVPEPGSLALAAIVSGVGVVSHRWRRRRERLSL